MNQTLLRYLSTLCFVLFHSYSLANCTPPLTGAPCSSGGLASIANIEPSISLSAGNPVNIVTGNKYQREIDLPLNPSAPGLEIVRHYNSYGRRISEFGMGWSFSYNTRVHRIGNTWQIVQADGSRIIFSDTTANAQGQLNNQYGKFSKEGKLYYWQWPSGNTITFNEQGLLTHITTALGINTHVLRYPDTHEFARAIKSIVNENEQFISFDYQKINNNVLVAAANTLMGRFEYSYDQHARLMQLVRPDGTKRKYLYEANKQAGNLYALTGITTTAPLPGQQTQISEQTAAWHYDKNGRVIKAVVGSLQNPDYELSFTYVKKPTQENDGLTIISQPNGDKTNFHSQQKGQRYVITKVSGSVCPGCPFPGTQANYDSEGRLIQINGTHIKRFANGMPGQINIPDSGWTNLAMKYNNKGFRTAWSSAETGTEQTSYNKRNFITQRSYANGDFMRIKYDILDQPQTITEAHNGQQVTTKLSWHNSNLVQINHPNETAHLHYDEYSRLIKQNIKRPAANGVPAISYKESFEYDQNSRLVRHYLAEGGYLSYEWGYGQQIKSIYWHDINGIRHRIIKTLPEFSGYRYGNGIHLDSAANADGLVRYLQVSTANTQLFTQALSYDQQQRIETETINTDQSWRYAYDHNNRMIGSRHTNNRGTDSTNWYAWEATGQAAATRIAGITTTPKIKRDATGLPAKVAGMDLFYSAGRRLQSVHKNGNQLVSYGHNAFGYQITKTTKHSYTHNYYFNNKLAAQSIHSIDTNMSDKHTTPVVNRRYIYAHHAPVAIIDYDQENNYGKLYYVHADLQGAPRLVTDSEQTIVWQTSYTETGQAHSIKGTLQLDLRLPGQFYDNETGLHDNLLRTFAPEWGHYLEPDPLGPVPVNQAYGYAAQQPRRYADPGGLLLFAFDGTRQSERTNGNVWKLSQYYMDGPAHYYPGPGNSSYIDWDALTANQAKHILDTQWQWLVLQLSRAQPNETTPIDILGFSRGAALARHFGNLINQHVNQNLFEYNDPVLGAISACVDLRFMGLFDSVAQFGIAGSQNHLYDLSINPAWEWVAHAVALHEHRKLFPLLIASDSGGYNVIETPFVGAHSDIGGGVLPSNQGKPGSRGDLSDIALNWMLWQARAALVNFNQPAPGDLTINNPILHDFRPATYRSLYNGDRAIQSSEGQTLWNTQSGHNTLGHTARTETEAFIVRQPNWRSSKTAEVGSVDLDGYARWLHDKQGWHLPPV